MAKKTLAELSAAFASKTTGNANGNASWKLFFPFWKMAVDTVTTVRFLPDANEDNPMGFLVENYVHELTINGKREKIACLKMYEKDCPICALSADYYDENSPNFDKALGKKYYRKKGYIGQCLVLETGVEHDATQTVKLIEFGPQVFKQMQAGFSSGDMDEAPYELKGGYNFRFRKSLTGDGQNSYTTSNFSPKQTDVADDLIESITLYDLSKYRQPKVEREVMEAMLAAEQTGGSFESGSTPSEAATLPAAPAPAPVTQATTTVAEAPAPTADGAKKLSVVEQLKARAAAAKAAQTE